MEESSNPDELSSVTTKLASSDVEYLDNLFTLDEYHEALQSLQPGKAPGSAAEFHQRFLDVLGLDLDKVLHGGVFQYFYTLFPMRTGHIGCYTSRATELIFVTGGL